MSPKKDDKCGKMEKNEIYIYFTAVKQVQLQLLLHDLVQ